MNGLVLQAATEAQLESFIARPAHALLIVGPEGVGKSALAQALCLQLLKLAGKNALVKYPYVRFVAPENGSISIDMVRALQQFTKLKIADQPAEKPRRIIILEQAHTMTLEAQNAVLKLLEEPPSDTLFGLTATNDRELLPTIRSRAQTISVKRPTEKSLTAHLVAQNFDRTKIRQAYLMSGGLPGLMHALLTNADHPLAQAATQARQLLQVSPFERLATVDTLAKQKADCQRVLTVMQQMAQIALEQAASKDGTNRPLARWQRILAASYEAEAALLANAQAKLVLTNFMLAL
ncbi:MAG TPA: AAA family ATPase [Candidatus Saccharimonadales bacterium]|jgi:DNA polymerase-3 subunit delta'